MYTIRKTGTVTSKKWQQVQVARKKIFKMFLVRCWTQFLHNQAIYTLI